MAVQIHFDTAKIEVNRTGAQPDVDLQPTTARFHLTQGFDPTLPPNRWSPAFNLTGKVKVTHNPGELANWRFSFIQVCRVNFIGVFYAGRRPNHGSVSLLAHKTPPLLGALVALDSIASFRPYTNNDPHFSFSGNIQNLTSDHPSFMCGLERTNQKTSEQNFLFHVLEDRQFWTVYTAEDPSGKRLFLAHVFWQARHNLMFRWRSARPGKIPATSGDPSRLAFGLSKLGPPTEIAVQNILNNPSGPLHNVVAPQAIVRSASASTGPPSRIDTSTWIKGVPGNFFS